jgi:hypothetical protein
MRKPPDPTEAPPDPAIIMDMRAKLRALLEQTTQTINEMDRQLMRLLGKVKPLPPVRELVSPSGKVILIQRSAKKRTAKAKDTNRK